MGLLKKKTRDLTFAGTKADFKYYGYSKVNLTPYFYNQNSVWRKFLNDKHTLKIEISIRDHKVRAFKKKKFADNYLNPWRQINLKDKWVEDILLHLVIDVEE